MEAREPLLGSAISAKQWLFVSLPRNKWAANQFSSAGLDSDLSSCLKELQRKRKVAVRLFHPSGLSDSHLTELLLMPEGIVYPECQTAEAIALLRRFYLCDGFSEAPSLEAGPSVFVCTHGKRDRCCAKYGRAVLTAFREVSDSISPGFAVRECTHLGGDRFAANVICFPSGHMYGHADPSNAPRILEAEREGRPYPPCYRGCTFLEGPAQLGEAAAQQECSERGFAATVSVDETEFENAEEAVVRLSIHSIGGPIAGVSVRCKRSIFEVYIDCAALSRGERRFVGRWTVGSLSWNSLSWHKRSIEE